MKHVAILAPSLGKKGGLERYPPALAEAFSSLGASVTLLTWRNPSLQTPFQTASPPSSPPLLSLRRLRQFDRFCLDWIEKASPDLVFGIDRHSFQTHCRAGNGVHAEYLKRRGEEGGLFKRLGFRLNPLHRTILELEGKAFLGRSTKRIFTNSEMVRQEILRHYPADPAKLFVVHNGVEWQQLEGTFQEKRGPCGEYRFLFAGNGWERKGLLPLFYGLKELKESAWRLTVVGRERREGRFIEAARRLGLLSRIDFAGPQQSLIPFYREADCLVLPSLYDPFANVTLEALAMGLFVVTSRFNGGKEVLTRETGCLIEELSDPESVKQALKQALKQPKSDVSARIVRDSVRHLELKAQLLKIAKEALDAC